MSITATPDWWRNLDGPRFLPAFSPRDILHIAWRRFVISNSVRPERPSNNTDMRENLPYLDWLRFLAALCVVACHVRGFQFVDFSSLNSANQTLATAAFFATTRLGYEAVVAFFVLSGYLVGGKLIERLMHGNFELMSYAIDRSVRIFLPLLPAIVITFLVQYIIDIPDSIHILIGNIFGMQGILVPTMTFNGPLWSLAYEMWFYILGGSLAALFVVKRNIFFYFLFILSVSVFLILDYFLLYAWIIGAVVYIWKPTKRSGVVLILSFVVTVAGAVIEQMGSAGAMSWGRTLVPEGSGVVLLASGLALMITQFVLIERPRGRISGQVYAIGENFSAFSYTLYLVHYPILIALTHDRIKDDFVDIRSSFTYITYIAFILIVSYLLYLLFEKQTSAVRRAIRKAISGHPR